MHARLADERGFALIMAIGILMVLTISVTSVITYTGAGSRGASLDESGQRAYALAEAGINNALSVLAKTGTDPTAIGAQPSDADDPYATLTTYANGGTARWGATYIQATRTWRIKSIGSTPNPTGPTATAVQRTLYADVTIPPPPYSFVQLDDSCDKHELTVRSSGTLVVTNGIYTNSCNASHDAFDVFGTGGSIAAPDIRVVGGWETHSGNDVIVGGVPCPLTDANPPLADVAGCPKMGQPVLADPFKDIAGPTLGSSPACPTPIYGSATSYSPQQKVAGSANMTATTTTLLSTGTAIANGDVIIIDSEKMLVLGGGGTSSLQVQRAYLGTTAAIHNLNKEIKKIPVTGAVGTAANPGQCEISSGTATLQPGTYYGGICIGGAPGADCTGSNCAATSSTSVASYSPQRKLAAALNTTQTNVQVDGTTIATNDLIQIESEWMLVTAGGGTNTLTVTRGYNGTVAAAHSNGKEAKQVTPISDAQVTLAPGTYIMAGGGFWVCGNSTLSAPNVLIYNTNDPTFPTGAGAVNSTIVNTSNSVSLGPQTSGKYAGLVFFQDRTQVVDGGTTCDSKNGNPTDYDFGFLSAASTGTDGALGSLSGTIYMPKTRALFVVQTSGKANLAVMSSCIIIDGGNATFDFRDAGLFGVGLTLKNQWG